MKIKYYGIRGSIPVSGNDYVKYGGNTTCVLVEEANTKLVLDAGTGIRNFGRDLLKQGAAGHKLNIIFSHYHWDHIQGFPFFVPAFIKGNEINLYGEVKYNKSVQDILKRQQEFITFPVELSGMAAKLNFFEVREKEELSIGPFKVKFLKINHPGGNFAVRIESKSGVFSYVTDYEHYSVPDNNLIEFVKNSNILVYDSHFTPEEYPRYVGWGHSTYEEGIKVAGLSSVKELHLCHHAPEHNDTAVEQIQAMAQAKYENSFAVQEGWEVEI